MQSGFGMIRVFISDWPAFTFSNHKTVRSLEVVRVRKNNGAFANGLFLHHDHKDPACLFLAQI